MGKSNEKMALVDIKKIILATITTLSLGGCASASKTYAPDGSLAYSLNCSGTARNWGMCYEKAGNLCKEKGYKIIVMNGENGNMMTGLSTKDIATISASSLHFRTMTIACK